MTIPAPSISSISCWTSRSAGEYGTEIAFTLTDAAEVAAWQLWLARWPNVDGANDTPARDGWRKVAAVAKTEP